MSTHELKFKAFIIRKAFFFLEMIQKGFLIFSYYNLKITENEGQTLAEDSIFTHIQMT